jgi:two-component system, OmpR family, sensor histidine kinase KdpD
METEKPRPNPEVILAKIKAEEEKSKKGKLTIYFGAAPGVGKTYSMLSDAAFQKKEGKDIVIGYFEPHKRPETAALLKSQEIIHPLTIKYKNIYLKEANVDAILKRKPKIAVLDELAHSNAPGSRHSKRYQDAEDLLNAGIDVWTTLNVQHLESLNDKIYAITKVRIHETLPDTIFQAADDVKLIDCSAETLLTRLKQGKIYVKDMADIAVQNFFKKENILSLREIALRLVLSKVNNETIQYAKEGSDEFHHKEKVLVALNASPTSEHIVRSAFQQIGVDGELIALYVETPRKLSEMEKSWISDSTDTAKKFGAQIVWIKGEKVDEEIANYANNHNVTKIVLGKAHSAISNSFAEKILKSTKDKDLIIISTEDQERQKRVISFDSPINFAFSFVAVAVISFIGFIFRSQLGQMNLLFLMLIPVIVSALLLGRGSSFFAAILSFLTFDYLFLQPYYTFAISDVKYILTFAVYVLIALIISNLTSKSRTRIKQLQDSESRSAMLFQLSKDLVAAINEDKVIDITFKHVQEFFPCKMAAFLHLNSKFILKKTTQGFEIDTKESTTARWVLINGKPAGQGTNTISYSSAYYTPMKTADKTIGVLGFLFENPREALTPANQVMLGTITDLAALSIQSIRHKYENKKQT